MPARERVKCERGSDGEAKDAVDDGRRKRIGEKNVSLSRKSIAQRNYK